MKKVMAVIAFFFMILSCDRYPDPEVKTLKHYSFNFLLNQGERFFSGELVSDSVGFHAVSNNDPAINDGNDGNLNESIKVLFEVLKGGGQITVSSANTDRNGNVFTSWRLGSESFEQVLRAKTFDSKGNFLSSSDLVAYGFRTNQWDTLINSPESGITGMAADTVNKVTFMIRDGSLYKEGDRYYDWIYIPGPNFSQCRTINIDRNQVFYITTGDGNMVRSTDHGQSWETCTMPYSESSIQYVSISNDNMIWVYSYNHPTRVSKDQGNTWTDSSTGFEFYGYGNVFRLKDGSLLLHGQTCCSLFRSFDDGLTWNEMQAPGRPGSLFVNDKDEIFLVSQQGPGAYIYKSTDYGSTFKYVYAVSIEWSLGKANYFNKWGRFYYVLIPGWGILKSADLTNYEIYWNNPYLKELYIDHNGVMIGKYWNWQAYEKKIVYYRKITE